MKIKVVYGVHQNEAATTKVALTLEERLHDYKDIEFVKFDVDEVFNDLEIPSAFEKSNESVEDYLAPERDSRDYYSYMFYLTMRQRPDLVERISKGEISDELVEEYAIMNRHEEYEGTPSSLFFQNYGEATDDLKKDCLCIELHNTALQTIIMNKTIVKGKSAKFLCFSSDEHLRSAFLEIKAKDAQKKGEVDMELQPSHRLHLHGMRIDRSAFEFYEIYKIPKALKDRPGLMKFMIHIEKNKEGIEQRYNVYDLPAFYSLCEAVPGNHTEDYIDITEKCLIKVCEKYNPD